MVNTLDQANQQSFSAAAQVPSATMQPAYSPDVASVTPAVQYPTPPTQQSSFYQAPSVVTEHAAGTHIKLPTSKYVLIGIGVALVGVLIAAAVFMTSPRNRSISVIGQTEQLIAPESAEVVGVLAVQATSLSLAQTESDQIESQLNNSLANLNSVSLQASDPQIAPVGLNAYQATAAYKVIVKDLEQLPSVVSTLSQLRLLISEVRYLPPSDASFEEQLSIAAIDDARQKARAIAKNAKLRLGKVLQISEVTSDVRDGSLITQRGTDGTLLVSLSRSYAVVFQIGWW